jgi:hypothetical protein
VGTSLQEALDRVLVAEGVRTVALIDIASGMADEARAARGLLGPRPGGELEEIAAVTGSALQLSKVLLDKPGEGFLLFVDLERARANIALASLLVAQFAPAVLA